MRKLWGVGGPTGPRLTYSFTRYRGRHRIQYIISHMLVPHAYYSSLLFPLA